MEENTHQFDGMSIVAEAAFRRTRTGSGIYLARDKKTENFSATIQKDAEIIAEVKDGVWKNPFQSRGVRIFVESRERVDIPFPGAEVTFSSIQDEGSQAPGGPTLFYLTAFYDLNPSEILEIGFFTSKPSERVLPRWKAMLKSIHAA